MSTSSMDVDPPSTEVERNVEFHALAIVHMSDQYTRISCGGSPLGRDAPVVGLLFGTREQQEEDDGQLHTVVKVLDADDVPTEISDATKQQIELHQAVFPRHAVVGWYRVSDAAAGMDNSNNQSDQPNAHDVHLTRTLQQHFCPNGGRFLFSLLQVRSDSDVLPLSIYELDSSSTGTAAASAPPVLIGTENWQLETSEPERIAVERVFREQTTARSSTSSSNSGWSPQESSTTTTVQEESSFGSQVDTIQQSLSAMNERLAVLIEYLEKTERGSIPPNPTLLRHVQALVCQLGPLVMAKPSSSSLASSNDTPMLLSHMAVVAKTVGAVKSYTDKFRSLHENRSNRTTREPRRF